MQVSENLGIATSAIDEKVHRAYVHSFGGFGALGRLRLVELSPGYAAAEVIGSNMLQGADHRLREKRPSVWEGKATVKSRL